MTKLASDKKMSYSVAFFTLAALLFSLAFDEKYSRWIAVAVLCVAAALTISFVKKRSILSYHKRNVFIIVLIAALLFLVLYYISGLYFGFGTTLITLNLDTVLRYVFPITATVLLSECVRAVLLGQKNRFITLIAYIAGVITEVLIAGGVRGIDSSYKLADFFGITLLPAFTANLFFNYISKRYGMLPNVAYRLILALYYYLIPFVPNAPQILLSFGLLLLPILVLAFIDVLYEKRRKKAKERKSRIAPVLIALVLSVMISFIALVSCQFRYGILVIGSPSMSDNINVGDAVVYEEFSYCDGAKENDVIVFTKDEKTRVVHRIISVNTVDGQNQYITKGDANEDPDPGFVTDNQIIGIVHFKVIYVGYPSLWLRQIYE